MYQFRQTQTAWGIREASRNGYDFFNLRMPVLGFPYQVPFEFPLFQNISALVGSIFELGVVESGRTTSLLFFCLGGILTFNLITKLTSASIAIFSVCLLYLTPFAIQWSNAVLIESLASFFLILSATFLRLYFERGSSYLIGLSSLALSFCALVKITTAIPLIFFLGIFLMWGTSFRLRGKKIIVLLISFLFSLAPAFAWTRYADSVKENGIFTQWLTSASLRNWNFGTLEQRINAYDWLTIFARLWLLGGLGLLVFTAFLFFYCFKDEKIAKSLILLILLFIAPITYFNLYVVHDYYFMAILLPLVLYFSHVLMLLKSKLNLNLSISKFFFLIFILTIPSWLFTIQHRDYKSAIQSSREYVPPLASEIVENTSQVDRIFVVGCDWDPTVLFYADRYGVAAPGWIGTTEDALDFLANHKLIDSPRYFAICGGNLAPQNPGKFGLRQISNNIWKFESLN
jgi:4-amino-4-deoxy-L-arabinose transferase-like glycosyltransferase